MSNFDLGSHALRLSLQVVIFLLAACSGEHSGLSKEAPTQHTQMHSSLASVDRPLSHAVPGKNDGDRKPVPAYAITLDSSDEELLARFDLDLDVTLDREYADEDGGACSWLRPGCPEITMSFHGYGMYSFITLCAGDLYLGGPHADDLVRFLRIAVARVNWRQPLPPLATRKTRAITVATTARSHVSYQRAPRRKAI